MFINITIAIHIIIIIIIIINKVLEWHQQKLMKVKDEMQIFVKTPEGKVITVIGIGDTTIDMVKAVISHKEDIPKILQSLSFNDKQLEDDHTLSDYNIQPKSMLTLNLGLRDGVGKDDKGKDKNDKGSGSDKGKNNSDKGSDDEEPDDEEPDDDSDSGDTDMQIFVKTPEGRTITLDVEASDTISNLKKIIKNKEGIPKVHQSLIYHDQQLEDDHTLSDYSIKVGDTITMTMSIKGGVKRARSTKVKPNPFEEERVQFVKHENLEDFESSFHTCINIANIESLDPITLLGQCDIQGLLTLKTHLSTGKAHHLNKVEEACDLLPFIQKLLKVKMFVAVSHDKYKKMMASTLWKLGCTEEGNFKMDVLIAVINGTMTAKAHSQPVSEANSIG